MSRVLALRNVPAANSPAADFDRLRQDLDLSFRHTGDGFTRRELGIEMHNAGAALRLGKHDGVGLARDNCIEVGVCHPGLESIDAHEQARPLRGCPRALEKIQRRGARLVLPLGGNRIFQIDDYGVCAAGHGLIELGFPVSGHEQKRAHGAVLIEVLGI